MMNVFCFNICNVFECLPPWPALYSFSESKPRPPPWSPVLTPAQLQFSDSGTSKPSVASLQFSSRLASAS